MRCIPIKTSPSSNSYSNPDPHKFKKKITSHHPLDDPSRLLAPARDDLRDLGPPHVLGPAPLEQDLLQVALGVRELERDAVRERERLRGVPADERGALGDGEGRADGAPAVDVVEEEAEVVVVQRKFAGEVMNNEYRSK